MSEVKNEGLEAVATLTVSFDEGDGGSAIEQVETHTLLDEGAHDLCRHSEAIAGYTVRDARISDLQAELVRQAIDNNELRAELARVVQADAHYQAEALRLAAELSAIKAQDPVAIHSCDILVNWSASLQCTRPVEINDPEGAWMIGSIDDDGDQCFYPVITVEADQYDAPGHSEKIAKAISALWVREFSKAAPVAKPQGDAWAPFGGDYDRAIHHNPDAKAWADLFVTTFPRLADKHDLMLGWFANSMMAMHDYLLTKPVAKQVVMPEQVETLVYALRDCRSDLFLQLEPKFGPEKAASYPSVVKADLAISGARLNAAYHAEGGV
jgi:hypothetical protein